jgi:L-alanine-DL-glutamate epimerase-like enolase superfamily enzyme
MNLKISAKHYQLPLKHPFTISRYTVTVQDTVIVCISNSEFTGYGEATANPYYGMTVERLIDSIESVKTIVQKSNGLHPEEMWHQMEPFLKDNYFALCAIDCAYWDFYAKSNRRTLRSFWPNNNLETLKTNYTIGLDSISIMKAKILETPWPIYKIKLGTSNDIEIVKALRKVTNAVFRIDANTAWGAKETLEKAIQLKSLGTEFIEQPLKSDDFEGMKILKENSVLPIIADESCQRSEDVDLCAEWFNGINIKLMKCGGITPALKMIERARQLNLKVMAGCMTESTIGISNMVQLASLLDYLDADGAMLLKVDIASGVGFQNGDIVFSKAFGSGSKLF